MYEIDPKRIDLAKEFKARPFGEHSPDLQYLLNLMRKPKAGPFPMLVMTEPYRQWTLAIMEPGATSPPRLTNTVFTSVQEAEWHVCAGRTLPARTRRSTDRSGLDPHSNRRCKGNAR